MHSRFFVSAAAALLLLVSGCNAPQEGTVELPQPGSPEAAGADAQAQSSQGQPGQAKTVLTVGAIPDQDPEQLNRLYGKLSDYLSDTLGVEVQYQQVVDYPAAVSAFRVGDLDLVWFGGLTGVQARLQVEGARAIAQRDIDEKFRSVFIANPISGIEPFDSVEGLVALKGHSLTFGSESSTSGRLMPQFFMEKAGVTLADLSGKPGFSSSHDATLELVQAGSFEVGAMNEQVWLSRLAEGKVDGTRVRVIFQTPPYFDYHWIAQPGLDERFGAGFSDRLQQALLDLDASDPEEAEILDLFGADKFIATRNENYAEIEAVGRAIGKIQ